MTCASCQAENPGAAAFCMRCGAPLQRACASCGTELPAEAAFCFSCGTRVEQTVAPAGLASPAPPATGARGDADQRLRGFIPPELLAKLESAGGGLQGERRRVTMLFCDVTGSTAAAQHLDPEEWAEIMNGAFEHLIAPVYRYEGTLARLMGDAVLAFFGAPIAHEDDPERAVRAGLEIVSEIDAYRDEVRRRWGFDFDVRVGINTGLVVVGAVGSDLRVEYTAMGDAVNVAARMEQTAQPGTVQVSEQTQRLIRPLFEFEDLGAVEVRGRDEPIRAFRVARALERPASTRGIEGLRSPLVGRDAELARLLDATQSVHEGQGRIVAVQGEAGLGKSRLVAELRARLEQDRALEGLRWSEGRSLSYETATAYTPVRQVVCGLAGVRAGDSPVTAWERIEALVRRLLPGRVAAVATYLGALIDADVPAEHGDRIAFLQPPQLRGEIFRAAIELLAAMADERPLVLVFEDLHWADSASIELVRELMQLAERGAVLLLLVFRPNREDASWQLHETAEREHPHLYDAIRLGPLDIEDTRELVASLLAVDGLSESVRALILEKAEGNPYFVEEVIRSLIDRGVVAREGGRWVATSEAAAVAVPDTLSAVLTTRLDQLREATHAVAQAASVIGREFRYDELVAALEDERGLEDALQELQRRELVREIERVPKRVYRFKHVLVQEVAYETVLLRRRVELHSAVGAFLERLQPERVEDIADHFLRAHEPARALPFLVSAGERAARSYILPEAVARLERALELMGDEPEPTLLRRALEALGSAREMSFDLPGARAVYDRLVVEGERLGESGMRVSGLNKRSLVRGMFFGERLEALGDLEQSEAMARGNADGAGLIESCMAQCYLHTGAAEFDDVEYYMREVSRLGRELGAEEPTLFGMVHLAQTLIYLTRFDEAREQAQLALAEAERLGHAKFQAELLTLAIPFGHMRDGDLDAATAALERGMEIALRIGDREAEAFGAVLQGKFAMAHGAYEDALALFRRATTAADATGMPHLLALTRCVMGTCYSEIGGPMTARGVEYHRETLQLMEQPTAAYVAAWLWAEMGACALAAGDRALARELLEAALTRKTTVSYLMRPLALRGLAELALAERRLDEAGALFDECAAYVREHEMLDQQPALALLGARVEAAAGRHTEALARFDEADAAVVPAGMRRLQLETLDGRARSLEALGRAAEAAEARASGRRIIDEIAAGFRDDELRHAFVVGALPLIEA
jgi:class 3 adenylate cyclase/tetratricopeptide (TPR) repeat protein